MTIIYMHPSNNRALKRMKQTRIFLLKRNRKIHDYSALEPVLRNKRSLRSEKPSSLNEEEPRPLQLEPSVMKEDPAPSKIIHK